MPIYEYMCNKCGYIFEKVSVRFDVIKIFTECPICKEKSKKIMSSGNFIIKGYSAANNYSKKGEG